MNGDKVINLALARTRRRIDADEAARHAELRRVLDIQDAIRHGRGLWLYDDEPLPPAA